METCFCVSPFMRRLKKEEAMEFCCYVIIKIVCKLLYATSIFICVVAGATFGTLFGAAIGVRTGCLSGAVGGAIKCCVSFTKLFDFSLFVWKTSDDFASWHLLQPIMVAFYYYTRNYAQSNNEAKEVSSTTKVKKFKKIRITRENMMDSSRNQNSCSICLQDFLVGEKAICLVQCHHVFHQTCIWRWLVGKRTCPLCRRRL